MTSPIKNSGMTLSERVKHWRDKALLAERRVKTLEKQNIFLNKKIKFLLQGKKFPPNFGRGKWLKMLKNKKN